MPTLTSLRTFGSRIGATAALTALTAAGATWLAAPAAMAQGEGGDIRIHRVGVPFGVPKDDPVVCRFYLEAVNFDNLPSIAYTIQAQPPLPTSATVSGTIALGAGAGHTEPLALTDGQYKLIWSVDGTTREKLFRVNCRDEQERHDGAHGPGGRIEDQGRGQQNGAGAAGHDGGPKGAVHAGAGGLAPMTAALAPLTGAAAVGLAAAGAAAYVRRTRRQPHGAA
ncbi:hypothetical protein [Streptomyces thermogriseus]|uniref:Uncharacterized protein n=1 Tax=Streptomyces thermogriseus TaxID=75292 RepID=A0ABN1SYC2_9ACTN